MKTAFGYRCDHGNFDSSANTGFCIRHLRISVKGEYSNQEIRLSIIVRRNLTVCNFENCKHLCFYTYENCLQCIILIPCSRIFCGGRFNTYHANIGNVKLFQFVCHCTQEFNSL